MCGMSGVMISVKRTNLIIMGLDIKINSQNLQSNNIRDFWSNSEKKFPSPISIGF